MQSAMTSSLVSEAGPDGGWDLEPTEWDQSGMGSTLVVDDEDSSGRSGFVTEQHDLVPHGVIGAEYRSLKASANGAVGIASLPTPQRDPYHGRCVEPRTSREPGRESFNLMVVGEAGLGKTTLLESFFKSFRDEDATSALFERKETQKVIETRRLLEDAGTRRDTAERAMKAAAETGKYKEAKRCEDEIARLSREMASLSEELKVLRAADEKRRVELQTLRENARATRMEMKRAADARHFALAAEKQAEAAALQLECETLQSALREMRRDPTTGAAACAEGDEGDEELSKKSLTSSTVRVSRFDPFCITVGKHELVVSLIDTPGYGENLNTVDSFDVITSHVEGLFEAQLVAETSAAERDYERLRNEDPLVHVCLYFIAPHRLKHIDVEFMRRLHKKVNIVPIIAKSDTMTTKEKEEFKLQVRETLAREGIEPYAFDPISLRAMEAQDRQEYKLPWAVIGSTDAHLDAGVSVYLRKYPWGNALSSEPSHSDLPALRNLVMWSGQWQELKHASRMKYENWRVSRSLATRSTFAAAAAAATVAATARRGVAAAQRAAAAGCSAVGVAPRTALRLLALLALLLTPLVGPAAHAWYFASDPSAAREAKLMRGLVDRLAAEKGQALHAYERRVASLSGELHAARALGEEYAARESAIAKERDALLRQLRASKDRQSDLEAEVGRVDAERALAEERAHAATAAAGGRCWSDSASEHVLTGVRSILGSTDRVLHKAGRATAAASVSLRDAATDAAREVAKELPLAGRRAAIAAGKVLEEIKATSLLQPVG